MLKQIILCSLAVLVCAGAALAGDWPQFQQNAQRHGRSVDGPDGPFRPRWIWFGPDNVQRNKNSNASWKDDLDGRDGHSLDLPKTTTMTFSEGMQPVHADGVLYALDQEGQAYAINMDDGATKWVGKNPGGSLGSPAVVGKVLVCASITGRVTGLNLVDGKEAWAVETGRSIGCSPAAVGETVYVANHGGYVYSINAPDGQVNWKVRLSAPAIGGIAADEKGPYLGVEDMYFYALDAKDGKVRARKQLIGQSYNLVWPVVFNDKAMIQTAGAVCTGSEGVMDDVLRTGQNPQEEDKNILRWLGGDSNNGQWKFPGAQWRHFFALNTADLSEPYIVANGPIEGCGTPANPPCVDNQGRLLMWWRTKFPTLTSPKGGFGTSFGLDISALDPATGKRVAIDNGKFSGQGGEVDNLFALSVGGDIVFLRQRFRGTNAVDLKKSIHYCVQVESRSRDGGSWQADLSYVASGNPGIQTPTSPASTRTAPSISSKMFFFAEGYCISAMEHRNPAASK